MKLKKILFLIVIFFAVLVPISNADTDEVNLDFSKIADRFNKCYYTSALSSIGVSVKATKVDDSFVLTYNNSESITYSYNKSSGTFSTTYPITNDTEKDILSALFVDAISTLEGNEEGSFIFPMLNDTFCYSTIKSNGVAKNYISNDGGTTTLTEFQVSSTTKLSPMIGTSTLSQSNFNKVSFDSQEDCIVKNDNLILLKSIDQSGNIVLYIGQPTEFYDNSYESVLNAVSYLFSLSYNEDTASKVVSYFRQNYSGFSVGNAEFEGVSVNVDIDSLPTATIDSILVSRNMKYAKFTINADSVVQNSQSVSNSPSTDDAVSISKKRISPILNVSIGIIILVVIIMFAGFFIRRHAN